MSNLKEYLESRTNNPFWWAFIVSFLILNWKLVVASVFEFSAMNYVIFEANLVAGFWLLIPIGAGFLNAIFGQSFTEFLAAASLKIHNITRLKYIKLSNETIVAKSAYDNLKDNLDNASKQLSNSRAESSSVSDELILANNELSELKKSVLSDNRHLLKNLKTIKVLLKGVNSSDSSQESLLMNISMIDAEMSKLINKFEIDG